RDGLFTDRTRVLIRGSDPHHPRVSFTLQIAVLNLLPVTNGRYAYCYPSSPATNWGGRLLRRRDCGYAHDPVSADPAGPDRSRPCIFDRALSAYLDGRAVDPASARFLGLPDGVADRDDPAACAEHRHYPSDLVARRRRRT